LKEFKPANSLAYSICEPDFGPAMAGIGKALNNMMGNLCVPYKLADTSDAPGLQADCRVAYLRPTEVTDSRGNPTIVLIEDLDSLPRCDSSRTPDCWEVKLGNANGTADEQDTAKRCPPTGSAPSQMVNVVRAPGEVLKDGTEIKMECLTCVDLLPGLTPIKGCE
jgi:hypothetical protein